MEKTWASGALELLKHADEHINKGQAFDQRIAFISIDNSVETAIRTFIFMPFSLSKVKFSFKEKEEIGNSFPKMVNLLCEKASSKISGIELSDIEFYHRLRNQLYHDGTGLGVDKNHLEAYRTIGELLLKNLFQIEFNYSTTDKSLSSLIVFWEEIDKLIKQLFQTNNIDFGQTFKWEEALQKNIITKHQISLFTELKRIRNEQVHSLSNEINLTRISYGIEIASELRKTLEKDMTDNILKYFKEHPTEVFAIRAIGHIFSISKSFASQIIESLEQEGKLISGIEEETGIKLFQIC
ncbi:hypothetical protein BA195_13660 [Tenacibaculum soleae]|uniref:Uncharacterized protein n=1 Tax=Tenacibaculum soleae TaxID=447689 RepID=A0A1B9XW99_9FLAO|nr:MULTISPECIES: hypothetical protein [Flavobacteriaceae]OCK41833.1 hypothetical protein BA195_13660 [Tenacibaculum soleae]